MDRDDPQLHPRFPRGNLGLPPLKGGGEATLSGSLTSPPPGPCPSRERGAGPERPSAGPWPCGVERRARRSPLRPSLERGPHQGPELGFLGLRIRSLTAAPAFRHLVRVPGPAGPDIRLAHSVLRSAPTHARTHARTHVRAPKPLPSSRPAAPASLCLSNTHDAPPLSSPCAVERGGGPEEEAARR